MTCWYMDCYQYSHDKKNKARRKVDVNVGWPLLALSGGLNAQHSKAEPPILEFILYLYKHLTKLIIYWRILGECVSEFLTVWTRHSVVSAKKEEASTKILQVWF